MAGGVNHFSEINLLTDSTGAAIVPKMTVSNFVVAVIAAFYAFTGFESVASGATDMENPEKNLPKAIPLAIGIIAIIYTGIVVVAMFIDPKALIESDEVVVLASIFNNKIIYNLVVYGAFISMFGINVASSFHTPRLLEALASEHYVSNIFTKRTSKNFPLNSFILTALVAIVIPMAFRYQMTSIMVISSISRFIQFIIVPLAVIKFYYGKNAEPIIENAYKNKFTDVYCPILSIALTCLLLIKFDWVGQFSLVVNGMRHMNFQAIAAMIIGYIVLPMALWFLGNKGNVKNIKNSKLTKTF